MHPLSNNVFWHALMDEGALAAVSSEDLVAAALTATPATDPAILGAVMGEVMVRARRTAVAWTFKGHHAQAYLVDFVESKVRLALAKGSTQGGKALCGHFQLTIKSWIASEYAKMSRRSTLSVRYAAGFTVPTNLGASQRDLDLRLDFWRIYHSLNGRTKEAVRLRSTGLTNAQVGVILGVSEASVRRWLAATGLRDLLAA